MSTVPATSPAWKVAANDYKKPTMNLYVNLKKGILEMEFEFYLGIGGQEFSALEAFNKHVEKEAEDLASELGEEIRKTWPKDDERHEDHSWTVGKITRPLLVTSGDQLEWFHKVVRKMGVAVTEEEVSKACQAMTESLAKPITRSKKPLDGVIF